MAFTKTIAAALLEHFFGKSVYSPINLYIGLSSTTGSVNISEIVGGGYVRLPTTSADWSMADISGNATITNAVSLTFPTATASWGAVKEVVLFDTLTGGTPLARADAASDKTVAVDDVLLLLPGKLSFILF